MQLIKKQLHAAGSKTSPKTYKNGKNEVLAES